MNIKQINEEDSRIENFINEEFSSYAEQNNVASCFCWVFFYF